MTLASKRTHGQSAFTPKTMPTTAASIVRTLRNGITESTTPTMPRTSELQASPTNFAGGAAGGRW
jgi:hypothetical protein